jgi:hypothetical protein
MTQAETEPAPRFLGAEAATFAIVLSNACIAVAIISATAACRRPELRRMVASTVIQSYCTNRSRS